MFADRGVYVYRYKTISSLWQSHILTDWLCASFVAEAEDADGSY